jgi:hypothetical protein
MTSFGRMLTLITLIGALVLTGASIAQTDQVDPEGFFGIRVAPGLANSSSVLGTLDPLLEDFLADDRGRLQITITLEKAEANVLFGLIETGYADDSVRGRHLRGTIISTSDGWQLIDLSRKWLCYRGKPASGLCS